MKKVLLFLAIVSVVVACTDNNKTVNDKDKTEVRSINNAFNKLLEEYYEEGLKFKPLDATYSGDNRYNDYFPNTLTNEFKDLENAYYNKFKQAVLGFEDKSLSNSEKMSKAILLWECDINIERLKFNQEYTPLDPMWSINLTMAQFASGESAQPFETVEDYKNWLKRLDGYLVWMDTAEQKMREGIKVGHVLPKALTIKVVDHLASFIQEDLESHLFYKPILNLPTSFGEEDRKNLTDEYQEMVLNKVIPAYQKLYTFMSGEYLEASRLSSGVNDIPNGEAYYKHQIKTYTTTELSAQEIHEIGLMEVERIKAEMETVKKQVGFDGTLVEFFDFVRKNKELMPYENPQQIIDNFNAIHDKMKPQLEQLFGMKPKTAFEVRQTESFREKSASAEYQPGAKDGSRPGVFYTPIPDASKYNVFSDEALFLHEAIPGHHYQVSLTQENEDLPEFRKTLWYSAYGEGWALYTEALGKELGLYTDPYQYFGMLSMEMHRAIRLVVDPAIHVMGWTREEAIDYSMKNEAEPEASIVSEIERYMANPGQALSYKIGQLKIKELRARAEKRLGDKFDIREFHKQILETGCIPLALLEAKMEAWMDGLK